MRPYVREPCERIKLSTSRSPRSGRRDRTVWPWSEVQTDAWKGHQQGSRVPALNPLLIYSQCNISKGPIPACTTDTLLIVTVALCRCKCGAARTECRRVLAENEILLLQFSGTGSSALQPRLIGSAHGVAVREQLGHLGHQSRFNTRQQRRGALREGKDQNPRESLAI